MFAFFRRFLVRFYAPEIETLKAEIKSAINMGNWWEAQFNLEKEARKEANKKLFSEISGNRRREDALKIGQLPPARASLFNDEPVPDTDAEEQTRQENEVLQIRAAEMAEQEFGENYTSENFDYTLSEINKNRTYYLSN